MVLTRIYLRASTDAQDATRAREQVGAFAADHGLTVAATYIESESGAKLARPELFRLLAELQAGRHLAHRTGRPAFTPERERLAQAPQRT